MPIRRRPLVLWSCASILGCGKDEPPPRGCATPIDAVSKDLRQKYAYAEVSPREEQRCDNCIKYVANQFQACGGCLLFSGPVAPAGWCEGWAASELKK